MSGTGSDIDGGIASHVGTDVDSDIDLARVQEEIAEEVRRRRAAGDFPPGLEQELDAMFARYAPAGTSDDFDDVLAAAEAQSFIHADVPTASQRRPLGYVKRALRKVMAWYMRFLAQQVTAFAGTVTRAVALLGHRVESLERVTLVRRPALVAPAVDASAVVVPALAGTRGRVLHAECGDGALVRALVDAGVDAYGVEPMEAAAAEASDAGLDVRTDTALAHLRKLGDAALAAVVLSGCTDTLAAGDRLAVIGEAARVLAPGGALVVVSAGPRAWARGVGAVVADLSPGRPWHPETWAHVLSEHGLVAGRTCPLPSGSSPRAPLAPVPAATPAADVLNANLERLNAELFADDAYAVVAERPTP
ncbi:MAG TPA: methionine biosynthesis protein MetW [Acidimicrobiales bacterium]|nr:methionine biosynthesis protein MetW [Acidimicrobiales bacterium]